MVYYGYDRAEHSATSMRDEAGMDKSRAPMTTVQVSKVGVKRQARKASKRDGVLTVCTDKMDGVNPSRTRVYLTRPHDH